LAPPAQATNILREVFGYDSFRPLQEEVIQRVLSKKDTLVVMPTGGGKSLCYQIPALLFDGLTVVVSPLISLMKDQVEQLDSSGVKAVCLNSSIPFQEYQQNVDLIKQGEAKLLYLAPETLLKPKTQRLLSEVKVDCLTIDEAHCISEWGHDFRPEYRQIAGLRTSKAIGNDAVCLALTATATPRVQQDIKKNLELDDSEAFIASFDRENLFIEITEKQDPFEQTLGFLEKHQEQSGIIYCFSRKQVDDLSADLSNLGYSVRSYHAGLTETERTENQEAFIRDDVDIMVATIAFGMGINKPDVRFVVHYDLPQNIESYYQQIGRAGRDGLRADCLLLFSYSDIGKINYFINQKSPDEQKVARAHLDALLHFVESAKCRRIPLMDYFGETYPDDSCDMCDNCVYEDREMQDLTIPAQKFLSCMVRTGETFGSSHLAAVLRGSKAQKILSHRHDQLSTYGIGRELSRKQWTQLSRLLIREGYITQDEQYGSLKIAPAAVSVLKGDQKIIGPALQEDSRSVKAGKSQSKSKAIQDLHHDETLFEMLRKQRKRIADNEQIPPYAIFPDATLIEMSSYFPQSKESLRDMYGVGSAKLEKYGQQFLTTIIGHCQEYDLRERPKRKQRKQPRSTRRRHHEVGEAYNEGRSIEELTIQFKVKPGTIISHLEKYNNEGNPLRIDGIAEASTLSDEKQKHIFKVFEKEGVEMLRPVYDALDESVSYDELRLMRLYHTVLDR